MLATFTVNSTVDAPDLAIDGICDDGNGRCTVRAAIQESNASTGVADIVTIPAGSYGLSLAGRLEDGALSGDLDITDSVTINGAGVGLTTIDGLGLDRVFHIPFQGFGFSTKSGFQRLNHHERGWQPMLVEWPWAERWAVESTTQSLVP